MSYKNRAKKKKQLPEVVDLTIVEVIPSKPHETIECPRCEGDGQQMRRHDVFEVCGECNGSGEVNVVQLESDLE